jgi:hypothetical protein
MQKNEFQKMRSGDRIFSSLLMRIVTVTDVLMRNKRLLHDDLIALGRTPCRWAESTSQLVSIAGREEPLLLFSGGDDRRIVDGTLRPLTRCIHPLPNGYPLFTLLGEMDLDHENLERITPPMSLGHVVDHMSATCGRRRFYSYDLVFPATQGWVIIDDHEVVDPKQYLAWAHVPFPGD